MTNNAGSVLFRLKPFGLLQLDAHGLRLIQAEAEQAIRLQEHAAQLGELFAMLDHRHATPESMLASLPQYLESEEAIVIESVLPTTFTPLAEGDID